MFNDSDPTCVMCVIYLKEKKKNATCPYWVCLFCQLHFNNRQGEAHTKRTTKVS